MTDRKMQILARKALGSRARHHVWAALPNGYIAIAETSVHKHVRVMHGDPRVAKLALEAALQAIVDEKKRRKSCTTT